MLTLYNYSQAQIWSYVEGCIAFFAACLPAGRVLLARKRQRRQRLNELNKLGLRIITTKSSRPMYDDRLHADEDFSPVVFKTTSLGAGSTTELTEG